MLDDPQKSYRPTPEKLRALWDIAMRLIAMREDFGRRIDMLDKKNSNILSKLASLPGGEIPGVPPGGPGEGPTEPPPPPPPPPPTNLPDLAIFISSALVWDDCINFTIVVTNNGTVISPVTTLTEIIPPLPGTSISVPSLGIGESFTTVIPYTFNPLGTPETKTLLAEVNPSHSFLESSFSNNSNSSIVQVNTPYPPTELLPDIIVTELLLVTYENVNVNLDGYYYQKYYGEDTPDIVNVTNIIIKIKNVGTQYNFGGNCRATARFTYPYSTPTSPEHPLPYNLAQIEVSGYLWKMPELAPGQEGYVTWHDINDIYPMPFHAEVPGYIWKPIIIIPGTEYDSWWFTERKMDIYIEANELSQIEGSNPPQYIRSIHESNYGNNSSSLKFNFPNYVYLYSSIPWSDPHWH